MTGLTCVVSLHEVYINLYQPTVVETLLTVDGPLWGVRCTSNEHSISNKTRTPTTTGTPKGRREGWVDKNENVFTTALLPIFLLSSSETTVRHVTGWNVDRCQNRDSSNGGRGVVGIGRLTGQGGRRFEDKKETPKGVRDVPV